MESAETGWKKAGDGGKGSLPGADLIPAPGEGGRKNETSPCVGVGAYTGRLPSAVLVECLPLGGPRERRPKGGTGEENRPEGRWIQIG